MSSSLKQKTTKYDISWVSKTDFDFFVHIFQCHLICLLLLVNATTRRDAKHNIIGGTVPSDEILFIYSQLLTLSNFVFSYRNHSNLKS